MFLSERFHKSLVLALVAVVQMLRFFSVAFFPTYASRKGLSEVQIGAVFAITPLCRFAAALLCSFVEVPGLSGKSTRRYAVVMCLSAMCFVLAQGAFPLVDAIFSGNAVLLSCGFGFLNAAGGVMLAMFMLTILVQLQRIDAANFGKSMSQVGTVSGVVMMGSPALGALLYDSTGGIAVPFGGCAGLAFVVSAVLLRLSFAVEEKAEEKCTNKISRCSIAVRLLSAPSLLLVAFIGILPLATIAFIDALLPLFLNVIFGITAKEMGAIQCGIAIVYVVAVTGIGRVIDRVPNKAVLLFGGCTLQGTAMLAMGVSAHLSFAFASLAVLMCAFAMGSLPFVPLMIQFAVSSEEVGLEDNSHVREVATALTSAIQTVAFVPGSVLGAELVAHVGFRMAYALFGGFVAMCGILAMVAVLVIAARRRKRQGQVQEFKKLEEEEAPELGEMV